MNPADFSPKMYYQVTYLTPSGRRPAIDALVNMLHEEQLAMIDQAVELSNLREARELIDYIRGL